MNKQKHKQLLAIGLALLAVLSCRPSEPDALPTVTLPPPTEAPTEPAPGQDIPVSGPGVRDVQGLLRATVQIVALFEIDGGLQPGWSGSGTILTPDGLILTNAHVAGHPDPSRAPDALGVALTIRSDEPPEPTYIADVVVIDHDLDLAVIQIARDLDGTPIDEGQLNLAYVPLGDSDLLELGDSLRIIGYPGIGGETITFTEGKVSGFTRERGIGGRAWVKTDATIAGGNSGGLASNESGQIVGVPTQVGHGDASDESVADCRPIADTNGDGFIGDDDDCVPLGGFINAVRPVNLAKPLVEAARTGIAPRPGPGPGPTTPAAGEVRFYNLIFAPDVTENDQPTRVVTQLPSGATSIYALWDYEGIADGVIWEARWYHDGQLVDAASQPPSPWRGGSEGSSWWVSIYNSAGLDDGTYRVELYVEGEKLLEGAISVGGAAGGPAITNLTFAATKDRPSGTNYLLPSGISRAYAFFDYENMRDGMAWRRVWTYEDEQVAGGSDDWEGGASGSSWVSVSAEEPLEPGNYRLELSVEDTLVAASNFVVAGTQSQEAIGPITFASGVDAQGNPVNPGSSFPSGLTELHVFFDFAGMQDGLELTERWLLDGEELASFETVWDQGPRGTFHDHIYRTSGEPWPDGQYALELYVEGQLVQSAAATVGSGTTPPTPQPAADGLTVYGTVLDADTGLGIPGALFVVFQPGVTVDGWDGSEAQIYTEAETDVNGYFELPLPLERGRVYSMIAWAEGYRPTGGDDIEVGDEPSPYEMEIELQRE